MPVRGRHERPRRVHCPFPSQHGAVAPRYGHVVLELGHIAGQHLCGVGERASVLGLPHRALLFDVTIERAAAPGVHRAGHLLSLAAHALPRGTFIPLAVERLGPAPQHHRDVARQVLGAIPALLPPQPQHASGRAGQDHVGVAASDQARPSVARFGREADAVQQRPSKRSGRRLVLI
jgi:hypothetical protein